MPEQLSIALYQCNPLCAAIDNNTANILEQIAHHKKIGTDLLCIPEFALCGYPPEDLLYRAAFHDAISQSLQSLCDATTGKLSLLVSYPHKEGSSMTNRLSLIQDGRITVNYDKQCLPNTTTFDEKRYFKPGNKACSISLKGHRIGLLICEDVWCNETVKKTVALGTEALIIVNASPYAINKQDERLQQLKHIASTHQQTCCYLNIVGGQDELIFDGRSVILNNDGSLSQEAKAFAEDTLHLQLGGPSKHISQTQATPEEKEKTLYNALVFGVREYITKNRFPGVLLGLSGGIDSALTLAIAVDALGASNVHAVMMPTQYTSKASLDDARLNAEMLNVTYDVIDIEPLRKAMLHTLEPHFQNKPSDTTEENLQARIRGNILMALSNKHGKLVLCTGNKSEMAVGYSTLYGDLSGGFCPLKDVFKTTVYRLANYRNTISKAIPDRIMTREPSAELAPDQRDEDSLPPYSVLDNILKHIIHEELSADAIIALGFDAQQVHDTLSRINKSEYKRRQTAIGIRVSGHAFGRDRRYPITRWHPKKGSSYEY